VATINPNRKLNLRETDMRTARLLCTIVGCGAVALGLGFAAEPSDPARELPTSENRAQPSSDRPSDEGHGVRPRAGRERANGKPSTGRERVSGATQKAGSARLKQAQPAPRRPDQKPTGNDQAGGAGRVNFHPPAWNQSASAVPEGLTVKKPELLHTQSGLSPILRPATRPSLPVAPSPGRGLAALGGPTFPPAKNSGVLNGTGMNHKP
jgi:hypothetical protein